MNNLFTSAATIVGREDSKTSFVLCFYKEGNKVIVTGQIIAKNKNHIYTDKIPEQFRPIKIKTLTFLRPVNDEVYSAYIDLLPDGSLKSQFDYYDKVYNGTCIYKLTE